MMGKNVIVKAAVLLVSFAVFFIPSAASAAFTASSPEFREVVGQLHMDGHSEHEITTCKVRKVYNSEVLEMLNRGMKIDDILKHYKGELGPQALKVPDTKGSGLLAWLIPGAGVLVGGAAVLIAIRRVTVSDDIYGKSYEDSPEDAGSIFLSFEKTLESERKKHF